MTACKYQRRVCDRCSASVEIPTDEDGAVHSSEVDPGWIEVEVERAVTRMTHAVPGLPSGFDLCNQCAEALADWFAQR